MHQAGAITPIAEEADILDRHQIEASSSCNSQLYCMVIEDAYLLAQKREMM